MSALRECIFGLWKRPVAMTTFAASTAASFVVTT